MVVSSAILICLYPDMRKASENSANYFVGLRSQREFRFSDGKLESGDRHATAFISDRGFLSPNGTQFESPGQGPGKTGTNVPSPERATLAPAGLLAKGCSALAGLDPKQMQTQGFARASPWAIE
jgi:hypothetical protein